MKTFSYKGVELEVDKGVFYPTETSKILMDYLLSLDGRIEGNILDLGCGSGAVSLILKRKKKVHTVYASDVSSRAVQNAMRNARRCEAKVDIRVSDGFSAWPSNFFNFVICDISGVSQELARVLPWFGGRIDCDTGRDGTALVTRVIQETPRYLKKDGKAIFPVLTLSRSTKILKAMKCAFSKVKKVASKQFYLPIEMNKHAVLIGALQAEGCIEVEQKFGFYLWKTDLYEVKL